MFAAFLDEASAVRLSVSRVLSHVMINGVSNFFSWDTFNAVINVYSAFSASPRLSPLL
jgi:hypothetical protein